MNAPINADEIRGALEAHAQFDDTAALARLGSVKARVRVVRRRRRAALAGVAAAVVATAGGVATLLPGEKDVAPASRVFQGLTAPKTLTSEGATYTFVKMVTGDREARWKDPLHGPALVTWASPLDGPVIVTKTIDGEDLDPSYEDFHDFIALDGTEDQTVQAVTPRGPVALAVYELSAPAEGVAADVNGTTVVFRDRTADTRSVAAAWGDPGQTDLTLSFAYPERELQLEHFCTAPKGYDVHIDVEGPATSGACDDQPSIHGTGGSMGFSGGVEKSDGTDAKPGDRIAAHMWLSRKGSDKPVEGPVDGVRMGMAFAEKESTVATIGAWSLTREIEEAGHTWRFVRVLSESAPSRRPTVSVQGGPIPVLVKVTVSGGAGRTRVWSDQEGGTSFEDDSAGGGFLTGVGPLGLGPHTIGARTQHPATLSAALYELVD